MMDTGEAAPSFNDTSMAFLPKGEKPDDSFMVSRLPEDTRPLGLKNTDNKLIGAGTARKTRHIGIPIT